MAQGRGEQFDTHSTTTMEGGNYRFNNRSDTLIAKGFRSTGGTSSLYDDKGMHAQSTYSIFGYLNVFSVIFGIPLIMKPMLNWGMEGGI